jgi:predicted dehydrogenase
LKEKEDVNMTEAKAKIAIIGVGLMGESHAETYQHYRRSELVVVCDSDQARARAVGERFQCSYTTSYDDVAEGDADGVVIATPDASHLEPTLRMIRAGKHVLVEKPLATKVEDARQIVEAARDHKVKLMVNCPNRWRTQVVAAKDFIDSGQLGDPVLGYSRLSDALKVATDMLSWSGRSGPHWFLFPHSMDLMRWMIKEEPQEVYAAGSKGVLISHDIDAYDAIQALVKFDRAFVTFEAAWIIPNSWPSLVDAQLMLQGGQGRIDLNLSNEGVQAASDDYAFVSAGRRLDVHGKLRGFIVESRQHFVDCILDDRLPLISGEDGLMVTAMIEAVERSLVEGRPILMKEIM